jgi:ParB family transcriptional regulator, chromosome partitioning protein
MRRRCACSTALLRLEEPKYTIEQIAARVGKSPAFIAQRLKLTDLVPSVVEAFYANDIGVGHALLIAKLPADMQPQALSTCFKEVYSGNSQKPARILLPVRNLQFWIETNVLLVLKDAPFDKRDAELLPSAGSCADCPKRTGQNKLLFGDDLGKQGDRCKLCGIWATASLSCWRAAAAPTARVAAIQPSVLLEPPPGGSIVL